MLDEIKNNLTQLEKGMGVSLVKVSVPDLVDKQVGDTCQAKVIEQNGERGFEIEGKFYSANVPTKIPTGSEVSLRVLAEGEVILQKESLNSDIQKLLADEKVQNLFNLLGLKGNSKEDILKLFELKDSTNLLELKGNIVNNKSDVSELLKALLDLTKNDPANKALDPSQQFSKFITEIFLNNSEKSESFLNNIFQGLKEIIAPNSENQVLFKALPRLEFILQGLQENSPQNTDMKELGQALKNVVLQQAQSLYELCERLPVLVGNGPDTEPLKVIKDLLQIKLQPQEEGLKDFFAKVADTLFKDGEEVSAKTLQSVYQEVVNYRAEAKFEFKPLLRMLESRLQLAFYDLQFKAGGEGEIQPQQIINQQINLNGALTNPENFIAGWQQDFAEQLKNTLALYLNKSELPSEFKNIEMLLRLGIGEITKPLEDVIKDLEKTDSGYSKFSRIQKNTQSTNGFERYEKYKQTILSNLEHSGIENNGEGGAIKGSELLSQLSTVMNVIGEPSFFALPFMLAGQMVLLEVKYEEDQEGVENEEEQGKDKKGKYQKFDFQIELPHLGKIEAHLAYREKELMLQVVLEKEESVKLIEQYKGLLSDRLKERGYTDIQFSLEKKQIKSIRPAWVADLYATSKSVIA